MYGGVFDQGSPVVNIVREFLSRTTQCEISPALNSIREPKRSWRGFLSLLSPPPLPFDLLDHDDSGLYYTFDW